MHSLQCPTVTTRVCSHSWRQESCWKTRRVRSATGPPFHQRSPRSAHSMAESMRCGIPGISSVRLRLLSQQVRRSQLGKKCVEILLQLGKVRRVRVQLIWHAPWNRFNILSVCGNIQVIERLPH